MRLHNMFKKTGEKITSIHSRNRRKPEAPEGILKKCNKCGAAILTDEVINGKYICPKCHGYFRIPAYKRIELVTDAGSFEEWDAKIDEGERPENPLNFRGYTEKVEALRNAFFSAGKVPSDVNEATWAAFKTAVRNFNSFKNSFYKDIKKDQTENLNKKIAETFQTWKKI